MNGHPSYAVRRHPLHFGWFMESCWCVLTAFPMKARGVDVCMEDEGLRADRAGGVGIDDPRQRREADAYNRAAHVQG